MENEKTTEKKPQTKIEKLKGIITILYIIFLVVFCISIYNKFLKSLMFYIFALLVAPMLFIMPFLDWLDKGVEGKRYVYYFSNLVNLIFSIMLCLLGYFVFKVQNLADKPYYSVLDKLCIAAGVVFVLKLIIDGIIMAAESIRSGKKAIASILKAAGKAAALAFPVVWFVLTIYSRPATVYLNDLKKPYELKVEKISEKGTLESIMKDNKIGTIKDDDLINRFINDIDNRKYSNIRNLDELNYQINIAEDYPYYRITPLYEGLDENQSASKKLESGYIYMFDIYCNGDAVVVDIYNYIKVNPVKSFFPKYRLHLSDSTQRDILNAIKSME